MTTELELTLGMQINTKLELAFEDIIDIDILMKPNSEA